MLGTYILYDGHVQVLHVGDDALLLWWDLGMLHQLCQVLLGDACNQTILRDSLTGACNQTILHD